MHSCLYLGSVTHVRLRPRRHRFKYQFTSWYLDLDELDLLQRQLTGFSHNKPGPISFYDTDFGPGDQPDLKAFIVALVESKGLGSPTRVCLLCQPRCLGYIFNSLSTYFCYDAGGQLLATLYEVSNTFGERHLYVVAAGDRRRIRQEAEKRLYVSPFMPMACRYRFDVHPPRDAFRIRIRQEDDEGLLFHAVWKGTYKALDARAMIGALCRPPMTLKTILAIHWEALRLWLKGTPIVPVQKTQPFHISLGKWQKEQ